ncbi:MAG: DUF2891 domain-containing protein [Crocinitomicaceae bacterium]
MSRIIFCVLIVLSFNSFAQFDQIELTEANAMKLVEVPIACIHKEYPNKLGQVLTDSSHIDTPSSLHPIFYGCFDWHSSVHGHWLMAKTLNSFPDSPKSKEIIVLFDQQFTVPNVQKELLYFQPKLNRSYERTYGWAWLLKLQVELIDADKKFNKSWSKNLQSLVDQIVTSYKEFLPKMSYPIRVGEHTNTAFGLSYAYNYAVKVNDLEFQDLISSRAKDFYLNDENCPLSWEPSGFDFISPCLQEAELMSKVLPQKEFVKWIKAFLPQLFEKEFTLEPGKVLDRTDGKLVHLDGLNFSRAWCFYRLSKVLPKQADLLISLGDKHIKSSWSQVVGSDYMGSHWLASFLLYAMEVKSGS